MHFESIGACHFWLILLALRVNDSSPYDRIYVASEDYSFERRENLSDVSYV